MFRIVCGCIRYPAECKLSKTVVQVWILRCVCMQTHTHQAVKCAAGQSRNLTAVFECIPHWHIPNSQRNLLFCCMSFVPAGFNTTIYRFHSPKILLFCTSRQMLMLRQRLGALSWPQHWPETNKVAKCSCSLMQLTLSIRTEGSSWVIVRCWWIKRIMEISHIFRLLLVTLIVFAVQCSTKSP